MKRQWSRSLGVEHFEERCNPTTFGIPWTDPDHLSISFVPDGTFVDGLSSTLNSTLNKATQTADAWKTEILRAFQLWSNVANINFHLVSDQGQDLGVSGTTQGDARFGDIRIAAHWLSYDALAITTPAGLPAATRTGDIVLNDKFTYGGGSIQSKDVFSVFLQEAGHALGIPNSPDKASAMYTLYDGVSAGLSSADVSAIQALYGPRKKDSFEGTGGNDSLTTAFLLQLPTDTVTTATRVAEGELTTVGDQDYYRFKTNSSNPNGVTVELVVANRSLVAGDLTIYDSSKRVIAQATGGAGQNLRLTLPTVSASTQYYVRVGSATGTAFAIGAYQLRVVFDAQGADTPVTGSSKALDDTGTNETLTKATVLTATAGYAAKTHYDVLGRLRGTTDVDTYKFASPTPPVGMPNVMTISVRSLSGQAAPKLKVYDGAKQLVTMSVLEEAGGYRTLRLDAAAANATYYVAVSGATSASNYDLSIDFRTSLPRLRTEIQNTLTTEASSLFKTLWVPQTDVRSFALSVVPGASQVGVRMTIYGIWGEEVATFLARAGETAHMTTLLNSGLYFVRFTVLTNDGSAILPTEFSLASLSLSDPISVILLDPTSQSANTTSSTDPVPDPVLAWSNTGPSTINWLTTMYPLDSSW